MVGGYYVGWICVVVMEFNGVIGRQVGCDIGVECFMDFVGVLCVNKVEVDFGVCFGGQDGFEFVIGIVVSDVVYFIGWVCLDYFQNGFIGFVCRY